MGAFLGNIEPFYGTGEKNSRGEDLETFLEQYNPHKYETPSCTTDAVIFSYQGMLPEDMDELKVLLVKRSNHPSIGFWALPGGFVGMKENLESAAKRELEEETGIKGTEMEQFAVFGDYDRDPRTRIITIAYLALVKEESVQIAAGDDAADAVWCSIRLRKENEEERGNTIRTVYGLEIRCEERSLETEAKVEEVIGTGLIREKYYRVLSAGKIAVDHAAIIVQAARILEERMNGK